MLNFGLKNDKNRTPFFPGSADSHGVNKFAARKILVVDDNPVILKALSLVLESNGHEVLVAADGPAAFTVARREKLDLVLLDILFPPDIAQSGNTWDGLLILDWLQRIGAVDGVPIIIISAAEPWKFKDRCLAAGAQAFFSKPLDIPRLLDTIRGLFGHHAPETVTQARPGLVADFAL